MADGKKAKERAAGSSIIMWRMNGSEVRNLDDMEVRRSFVAFEEPGRRRMLGINANSDPMLHTLDEQLDHDAPPVKKKAWPHR